MSRLLLPTVAAVFLVLTFGAGSARATGSSSAKSALEVSVQVVRSCAIDSTLGRSTSRLDAADREALLLAAQASLVTSCGATQTRIEISEIRSNSLELLAR